MTDSDLARCYSSIAKALGDDVEPYASVSAVERHRRFWRPASPKVVLLAESHVWTSESELLAMPGGRELGCDGAPETYVRFVYCLGYGEPRFAGTPIRGNGGTPQFWKLFWSCLHRVSNETEFAPLLVGRTEYEARLHAKRTLLETLRERGVWLLDASITALYRPGGFKPRFARIDQALRVSWDEYVSHVLAEARPRHTLVIGRGVARALADRLDKATAGQCTVLPEPQARLSREERLRVHQGCFQVCFENGVG